MGKNVYVLSVWLWRRFKTLGFRLICEKCGRKLRPGDKIVSILNQNGSKRYHLQCYEAMFIEA